MTAPLDPTILNLLRDSAVGPMLDRPVSDVLRDMGLPPLPRIPALATPDMPPMPVLDLHALAKPITDLAGTYGNGRLGAGTGPDPTQVLTQISTALQTAMSLGTTALQALMTLWQGAGAQAAATKAGAAAANGAELGAQSGRQKVVLGSAATSVATGAASMSAIIAKYVATMTAASPLLATPGGQVFLLAETAESLTEALAQIAATKTELSGHAVAMTDAGQKVAVTAAPATGLGEAPDIQQLLQLVPSLLSVAQTGTQAATQLVSANTAMTAPKSADGGVGQERLANGGAGGLGTAGIGADAVLPGIGVVAPATAPLSPFAGTSAAAAGPSAENAAATMEPVRASPLGTTAASPGMAPLGGAVTGAGSRGAGDAGSGIPDQMVTAQHGDEVVGTIQQATLPVVGAVEHAGPLPDKALTL